VSDQLRGIAVALNAHLAGVRRHVDTWEPERLRRELAVARAMLEEAGDMLEPGDIEAARTEARRRISQRSALEVDPLKGYCLWAETYDDDPNPVIEAEEPLVRRLLGEVTGLRVLDVGCGTGRWALRLARAGAVVTGVDPCGAMLRRAQSRAREEALTLDLRQVGFGALPKAQYDLVLCCLVLGHIPDVGEAIGQMAARVAPGGRLLLTDFHYLCLLVGWRTGCRSGEQRYHIENYVHDYGDYVRALLAAGLRLTAIEDGRWDERVSDHGIDGVSSPWWGFPLCMAIVGQR